MTSTARLEAATQQLAATFHPIGSISKSEELNAEQRKALRVSFCSTLVEQPVKLLTQPLYHSTLTNEDGILRLRPNSTATSAADRSLTTHSQHAFQVAGSNSAFMTSRTRWTRKRLCSSFHSRSISSTGRRSARPSASTSLMKCVFRRRRSHSIEKCTAAASTREIDPDSDRNRSEASSA